MAKVFITGITGFLGANIGRVLVNNGHQVIATLRDGSSTELCKDYSDKVNWVQQNADDWVSLVCAYTPQIIIHCAWIGVGHHDRDNWDNQHLNINYLYKVLEITKRSCADKFIGLGSQAEYGQFEGVVTEDYPVKPTEAYGRVKVICAELIKQYCTQHRINWYWLRLFSFFGKGESEKWLIPSLVKRMHTDTQMDFTAGEQKYAYLYVNDLGLAINSIITQQGKSGIYNISGKKVLTLRCLIEHIRDKVNSSFQLNFGALPYRQNQAMHMQGDSATFVNEFGEFDVSNFDQALSDTIDYLKKLN
jgi:nucleoside-diphosphate-sugar epimerase